MNTPMKRLLTTLLAVLFLGILSLHADADDPPWRVARLSFLKGDVSFEPSGEQQWSAASLNYPLTTGDRIYTNSGDQAEFETGSLAVRLSGNTDVTITNLNDQLVQLGLSEGVLRVRAYNMISGNQIEIDSPNASFTVLASGNYRIETYPNDDATFVLVNSGELRISGNGLEQTLRAGQAARLVGSDPVEVAWVSPPRTDDFDNWCDDRDRRYLSSVSERYVGPYVPGYYDLDSYGSWVTVAAYGPVWYPAGVAVDWVPYRYGRWAWISPWGWTWIEEEPWGFAPFHYGRWVQIGSRWGWCPGERVVEVRPVYAPALVAFIGGGFSVTLSAGPPVAWFPLGPREPYLPWYHHSDEYVRQVNVRNVRNITNITNVTNITNIRYVNREVATTAVPADVFRRGEPVRPRIVRVDRTEIERERVIPHPEVVPDARAIAAGTQVTHPPIEQRRPQIVYRPPMNENRPGQLSEAHKDAGPAPGPDQSQGQIVARPRPARPIILSRPEGQQTPEGQQANTGSNVREPSERPLPPRPVQNRGDENGNPRAQNQLPNERPLIARTPPPPPSPSFEQRRPAMEQHPGRPLEPQQVQNLRQGQPAGPMRDHEVPPHPQAQQQPEQRGQERDMRPR